LWRRAPADKHCVGIEVLLISFARAPHTHVYISAHTHTNTHARARAHAHAHIHLRIHTRTYNTDISHIQHTYTHTHTHARTHTHAYIQHIHHTHTHTHTHTQSHTPIACSPVGQGPRAAIVGGRVGVEFTGEVGGVLEGEAADLFGVVSRLFALLARGEGRGRGVMVCGLGGGEVGLGGGEAGGLRG
jgi:hypothetical protein